MTFGSDRRMYIRAVPSTYEQFRRRLRSSALIKAYVHVAFVLLSNPLVILDFSLFTHNFPLQRFVHKGVVRLPW